MAGEGDVPERRVSTDKRCIETGIVGKRKKKTAATGSWSYSWLFHVVECKELGWYLPLRTLLPALADNEILSTGESNRIAISTRREVDIATSLVVLGVILTAGETIA